MTKDIKDVLNLALDALEEIALAGMSGTGQESEEAMTEWHARQAWSFMGIAARALEPIKEALKEHAMREVQRLGQEIEQEPVCPDCKAKVLYECVACSSNNYPPKTEQEPVAHLWECLGRWSAYLVNNGTQADCAPPLWLVDAIKKATTPPQRTWVELTDEEKSELWEISRAALPRYATYASLVEAKLKERNT